MDTESEAFFACVKLYVVLKLFQSFVIVVALCNACGFLKLMIFCIVISLSCVVKFISLCLNMLYFLFLHFKLQLWFALSYVSLEIVTKALH
jgi:hypothetical protein